MRDLLKSKKLMKDLKKNQHHYVLAVLLALFIIMDIEVPRVIAGVVDNVIGKIAVVIAALSLFTINPLVGSLALVAGYVLVMRSGDSTGTVPMKLFVPTEAKKLNHMVKMNVKPNKTLEEETIKNMLPTSGKAMKSASYKPVLDKLHDATEL